ncbi:hypothetical protein A3Q35_17355 [Aeribacillus pallidus]|nr:hypothetical protein A3Q35_17355 [Aeribacillus pallidus]
MVRNKAQIIHMECYILENQRTNLTSMMNTEHLNYSINEHMKRIKESLDGEKIMQLFQVMAEHSIKYAGMSFMNNRTMAQKIGVSIRTIQRYTKKLEALKVILKIPTLRKKDNSQTSNTYVILPVLQKPYEKGCHGGCHPLNPSLNPDLLSNNKDIHINVIENVDVKELDWRYTSSYVPKEFVDATKAHLGKAVDIESYWNRYTVALYKHNQKFEKEYSQFDMMDIAIDAFRQLVRKHRKVDNYKGYFYAICREMLLDYEIQKEREQKAIFFNEDGTLYNWIEA